MKIYVSGSIYGGTEKIETYKVLIQELEKYLRRRERGTKNAFNRCV